MNEFHRGDIICRIGDTMTFVVLGFHERDSKSFSFYDRYRLMKVEEGDWGRNITYHYESQRLVDMTYVKIGKWDFKKGRGDKMNEL